MPQHKSCEKRMRTSAEARLRNRQNRSTFRSAEKKVLTSNKKNEAATLLVSAYEILDRMSAKGILHRNTAARHKAKLAHHVNSLQS